MDSSPSHTRLTSCSPCFKRKVKCDRQKPCAHCKRRKGDICEYPQVNGSHINEAPKQPSIDTQAGRIAELEQYIIRLGGDPQRRDSLPITAENTHSFQPASDTTNHEPPLLSRKRRGSTLHGDSQRTGPQGSLIEHGAGTTYIETPTWLSWDESRKVRDSETDDHHSGDPSTRTNRETSSGYCGTLLEKTDCTTEEIWNSSPAIVVALWSKYLANVHPIVKLFFSWDKDPLMRRAAGDQKSLSHHHRAFVLAVCFIATLSLSEEDHMAIYGSSLDTELDRLQISTETALLAANYAASNDLLVLQAFLLYILAMRNRARPGSSFSLMGIAVRTAQRLGLHRDGSLLSLSPMRAEEGRRVWWQVQHMEILASQLLGCISMTLYGNWNTRLPSNLEDEDVHSEIEILPPNRSGLTSMSHCLWRYEVIRIQRQSQGPGEGAKWASSRDISSLDKQSIVEQQRNIFSERYLQHCELINPLHIQIQVGIQNALLALQRAILQPGPAPTRLSDMSRDDREELLKVCVKSMEYYIITQTNDLIAHFRWHNESYFQWTAFVYILVETQRRAATAEVPKLWTLIDKVCRLHPKLTTHIDRPEVSAIGRLIIVASQERQRYLLSQQSQEQKPSCVGVFEKHFDVYAPAPVHDPAHALSFDMDFDLIDWSSWEKGDFWPDHEEFEQAMP